MGRIFVNKEVKDDLVKQFEAQAASHKSYLNIHRTKTVILGKSLKPSYIQTEIRKLRNELEKKELELTELTKQLQDSETEVIPEVIPVTQPSEHTKRNVKLVRKMVKSAETEAELGSVTTKTQRSRALISNRSISLMKT
jgi:hypothetical protein